MWFIPYVFIILFIKSCTLKEKTESFWLRKLIESLVELKFDPGEYLSQYLSQIDSTITQIFYIYSESQLEFKIRQWLNFLGQNNSIFQCFCCYFITRRKEYSSFKVLLNFFIIIKEM